MPQWRPTMPRTPFVERTIRLWLALALALACLVAGLIVGTLVGQAANHDDRYDRPPGFAPRGQDGELRQGRPPRGPWGGRRQRPPLPSPSR